MGNRAGQLKGERRSLVAFAVKSARDHGVPWKRLARIYDRDERHLRRLMAEAETLMSDINPLMSGLGHGQESRCGRSLTPLGSTDTAGDSMSEIFGGGQSQQAPAVQALPAAPTLSDPAVTNAARAEQVAAARTRGRAATILTGGQGTTTPAPTAPKVLFGS